MTSPKQMPRPLPGQPHQTLDVQESSSALAADASEMFVQLTRQANREGRPFRVALAGGTTPKLLYGLLASDTFRHDVPWNNVEFFFGDERWVPHTHRDSNYKLANDNLFKPANLDPDNIFPMPTEGVQPKEAAAQYEATLRRVFGLEDGQLPHFNLIFLGMGDDGHTASLFPYTEALDETDKLVAANYVKKFDTYRITLTAPVLNAADEVLVLVSGESKAPALKAVLEGDYNYEEYPSQLLRNAQGHVTWLVDRPAASLLGEDEEEGEDSEGDTEETRQQKA